MLLNIDAFNSEIPEKYTCDGEEVSPGMKWSDVPKDTKSFALIMEALDIAHRSNPLVLWLVYNIPGYLREILTNDLPPEASVGTNDLGKARYNGPCPEEGPINHPRYKVTLYALDAELDLPEKVTCHELVTAMKKHILEKSDVIASYNKFAKNRG